MTNQLATLGVMLVATAFLPALPAQEVLLGDATLDTPAAGDLSFAQLRYSADPVAPGEGKNAEKTGDKPPRLFHYSIRLGGRFIYSDNINFAPEPDAIEDFYVSLEPSISVGLGDVPERKRSYIRVDYSPNALLYFDTSEFNTLNHFIHLEAVAHLGRLTLSLYQDVHLLEGFDVGFTNPNTRGDRNRDRDFWRYNRDIAGRNEIEFYNTTVMAKYDITDKAWVTGAFRYNLTDYEDLFTLDIYSGDLFFDYKIVPELTVGIGGAGGVVYHDDPNIDEAYQEVRGRFTFDLPKRIKIDGNLGLEFRQFGRDGDLGYTAPIVEANVSFEPVEGTRLTIGARHRTLVSNALEGQSFTVTGANVGVRQRITERVDFNVNSGYEQASYFSVLPDVIAERRDEYYFVEPSIDWRITDKWTAGAYYIHRDNATTLTPFGFVENQAGLRTSVTF
jgi:hypothetical protein